MAETVVCCATQPGYAGWPCALPEGHWPEYHDDWNGRRWPWTPDEMVGVIRDRLAEAIWHEEQEVFAAIQGNPTDPHLTGVLRGLQRARTIAEGACPCEDKEAHDTDCWQGHLPECGADCRFPHGPRRQQRRGATDG